MLWRCVHAKRGGRRGLQNKVRHLSEGRISGVYSHQYPWVLQQGYTYASSWGFTVSQSVLQGSTVWEIQFSDEEILNEATEEPAAAKARSSVFPIIPKAKGGASSFQLGAVPKSAGPVSSLGGTSRASGSSGSAAAAVEVSRPKVSPAQPKAKNTETRSLRPRDIFPDTVLWFDKRVDSALVRTEKGFRVPFKECPYREYLAYKSYHSEENPIFPRFILFLDWHQLLDRSSTEGSWNATFPRDSVRFLKEIEDIAERKWGSKDSLLICVVTHIEISRFWTGELITSIFVTRERCGVTGKLATIKSFTRNFELPCAIVDDNKEVIQECSKEIHTCHVKIKRKPLCEEAECVRLIR